MEGLNKLFNYEYFGVYLIVSIIILVLLFLIILFFGKKDQKVREVEATKKLQQINNDTFKEEDNIEKLEVAKEEVLDNNVALESIPVPSVEDVPSINNIPMQNDIPDAILPTQNIVEPEVLNEVKQPEEILPEIKVEEPLLQKIEEKPFAFDNTNIFNFEDLKESSKVEVAEENFVAEKPLIEEIEVPEFNFDEIVKDIKGEESREQVKIEEPVVKEPTPQAKGPQIFSSVYVPPKKEEELPKVDTKVEEESELDFELPSLRKTIIDGDEEIEMPLLNDYNINDLSGESYTINK